MEDSFSTDQGKGIWDASSALHLLCTLFLLLLYCGIQGNNYAIHRDAESVGALSLLSVVR